MKIPEGFRSIGVSSPICSTVPAIVKKAIEALDALDFGLVASTKEVAALAGTTYSNFRHDYAGHPALTEYRFKADSAGSPILWGNKESIKKLIEANS